MKKISQLKLLLNGIMVPDSKAIASLETTDRGYRIICHVPDEDGDRDLDMHYQDIFPSKEKALREGKDFLEVWVCDNMSDTLQIEEA